MSICSLERAAYREKGLDIPSLKYRHRRLRGKQQQAADRSSYSSYQPPPQGCAVNGAGGSSGSSGSSGPSGPGSVSPHNHLGLSIYHPAPVGLSLTHSNEPPTLRDPESEWRTNRSHSGSEHLPSIRTDGPPFAGPSSYSHNFAHAGSSLHHFPSGSSSSTNWGMPPVNMQYEQQRNSVPQQSQSSLATYHAPYQHHSYPQPSTPLSPTSISAHTFPADLAPLPYLSPAGPSPTCSSDQLESSWAPPVSSGLVADKAEDQYYAPPYIKEIHPNTYVDDLTPFACPSSTCGEYLKRPTQTPLAPQPQPQFQGSFVDVGPRYYDRPSAQWSGPWNPAAPPGRITMPGLTTVGGPPAATGGGALVHLELRSYLTTIGSLRLPLLMLLDDSLPRHSTRCSDTFLCLDQLHDQALSSS